MPDSSTLLELRKTGKDAVPRRVSIAVWSYLALVIACGCVAASHGIAFLIPAWFTTAVVVSLWPLLLGICLAGALLALYKLLPLLAIAVIVVLLSVLVAAHKTGRTGQVIRALRLVFLGPYNLITALSHHLHQRAPSMTEKQSLFWQQGNIISLMCVMPVLPAIYCYLYRDKTCNITVAGCNNIEHLQSLE